MKTWQSIARIVLVAVGMGLGGGQGAAKAAIPIPRTDTKPVHRDGDGDRLPDGAIARLGSARWRHGSPIQKLVVSPDGTRIACAGFDREYRRQGYNDFSIRILETKSGQTLRRIGPLPQAVQGLAFSPSGQQLAASWSETLIKAAVCVWDVGSGESVWEHDWEWKLNPALFAYSDPGPTAAKDLEYYIGNPAHLEFTPDGKQLFVTDQKRVWRLLDAETGQMASEMFYYLGDRPTTLTDHGATLVSAHEDQTLRFRPAMSGLELVRARVSVSDVFFTVKAVPADRPGANPSRVLNQIWLTPDKRTVLMQTHRLLLAVDTNSGKTLCTLAEQPEKMPVLDVAAALSQDSRLAAIQLMRTLKEPEFQIVDVRSGQVRHKFVSPILRPASLAFTPDGKSVALAQTTLVRPWEYGSQAEPPADGHFGRVLDVEFSPDGDRVATVSVDGTARLWETESGRELHRWPHPAPKCNDGFLEQAADVHALAVDFAPDGSRLAIDTGASIDLLDCRSGKRREQLTGLPERLRSWPGRANYPAIFPDGKRVVCWHPARQQILLWDLPAERPTQASPIELSAQDRAQPMKPITHFLHTAAFSPSRRLLAIPEAVGKLCLVFDTSTGKRVLKLASPKGYTTACFSPDDKTLAVGLQTGEIDLVDVATGQVLQTLTGPGCQMKGEGICRDSYVQAFLDDGRTLVSTHTDNTTRFWDLAKGKETRNLKAVRLQAFSRDGRYAASVEPDDTVLIWTVQQ